MAWDDLIRSIMRACKILNIDFIETDLPRDWAEIKRLHDSLWARVYISNTTAFCDLCQHRVRNLSKHILTEEHKRNQRRYGVESNATMLALRT